MLVDRTVSEWRDNRWQSENRRLSDFRSARAYVLLGEPGSGKTTAFEVESKADGNASIVPARRFIRRHVDSYPEWRCSTLFVDGLDELRVGAGNPNEPLDAFLCRIEQLGQPRFRLSCREASWLGQNDSCELASVMGNEKPHLLRLNPLSPEEARAILVDKGVEHPRKFIGEAVDNGLEVFIENPLLLETLAAAVVSSSWPNGRIDTFERACEELAKELNESHLSAQDGRPFSTSKIVLAAGRLSALLLLSGKSGWSRRGRGEEDCPALSEAGDGQDLFKVALDTTLFDGSAETRHRAIGEFLAAKYLDHAITERHLVPGRVLTWMMGIDGLVMPDLRGVSVWLAAMNSQVRGRLIESDPIGLAFHGDAGRFSRSETQLLLDGLEAKLPHRREWPSQASLAALVAGPAREILWEMLRAADRSDAKQEVVELLLQGMAEFPWGGPMGAADGPSRHAESARKVLATVVRDPTWRSWSRYWALVALTHVVGNQADHIPILRSFLDDLMTGRVPADERGDLQGRLLTHLYPGHLATKHIWDYLPSGAASGTETLNFWTKHIVHESSPEDVDILLDTLAARAEKLIPRLAQDNLDVLVMRLLARGLELFGEEREVAKLYEWFELVDVDYESLGLRPAHCERVALRSRHSEEETPIYRWLRAHPDIQQALVLEGLKRHAEWPSTTALYMTIGTKFLGDRVPAGFRMWCLDQAVELATTDSGLSNELAIWAVARREDWGSVLEDDEIAAAVRNVPELRRWNENRPAAEKDFAEMTARQRETPAFVEFRRQKEAYVASVRGHMDAIQTGQGPPELLYELGQVYVHGLEAGGPDQACKDLTFHLDLDHELVKSVIRGFRCLVDRRDLPDLNGIVRLHGNGRMSVFAFPFLAGLTEDEGAGEHPLERLNDEGLGRALGFYLLSGLPTTHRPSVFMPEKDCRPFWYRQALRDYPQTVADAFVAVHQVRVRAKEPPDRHLYDLARANEYAEVARLAVSRMFTPFPSRCSAIQLEILRPVLWAARRYMCSAALRELVRRRLARKGMDIGQRVQWLATGALTIPDEVLPKLVDFLSEKGKTRSRHLEQRVHHLVDCLVQDREPFPNQEWPTTHLAALIGAVGRWVRPYGQDSSDRLKAVRIAETDIKAPPLVQHWIDTLAERVDEQAIAALGNLAKDPTLGTWRGLLVRALDKQSERHRMAEYHAPTLREIREAVDGGPPAGAADLAALVTDELNQLADRIRNGNTNDWRQYWHTDPSDPQGRTVIKPKPENLCRDHLLSALRPCLSPYDIYSEPEAHHAEDARSDILVVHGTHAVPVEIKKTGSTDLWSAIRDQLIDKYVRDPRSGGYGIYLVLWFGPEHLKSAPPVGVRPDSPDRLRQMLAEMLEPAQRRTISIVVVDVSAPRGRGP